MNPDHYSDKNIEPIDAIEDWELNFNLGNVIKYVGRHEDKDGLQDLKKALSYLEREVERRQ
jgi:hypothetical protein